MVLGWHIAIHRQTTDQGTPATDSDPMGVRLAVWQARLGGLDWLRELEATRAHPLAFADDGALVVPWPITERIARRAAQRDPEPILRQVDKDEAEQRR